MPGQPDCLPRRKCQCRHGPRPGCKRRGHFAPRCLCMGRILVWPRGVAASSMTVAAAIALALALPTAAVMAGARGQSAAGRAASHCPQMQPCRGPAPVQALRRPGAALPGLPLTCKAAGLHAAPPALPARQAQTVGADGATGAARHLWCRIAPPRPCRSGVPGGLPRPGCLQGVAMQKKAGGRVARREPLLWVAGFEHGRAKTAVFCIACGPPQRQCRGSMRGPRLFPAGSPALREEKSGNYFFCS